MERGLETGLETELETGLEMETGLEPETETEMETEMETEVATVRQQLWGCRCHRRTRRGARREAAERHAAAPARRR